MIVDRREQLREIRSFPSLVRFLRDELDWPLGSSDVDFEDLTFDYTPEELGIDSANAAKIDEIKRLRPLAANQPWGVFFVKFEPKRLPVVALRRILNGVVVKKRATASAAEQVKWDANDLLFISDYGEGDERKISFAHFSQPPHRNELPTLKVLAWDELDTPLHLEHAADMLVERLAWPAPAAQWDDETWRERWTSAFELQPREVITKSKILAVRLAALARIIRDRILGVLEVETEDGPVTELRDAFREALVHDLDDDSFADMYAQTIAYGLLSARIANPAEGITDDSRLVLPATNPFLKELMETFMGVGGRRSEGRHGIDFDELGVKEVEDALDDANMEAILRDFGDRNPLDDPVIHFYEFFLKEYDAKKRMQRGVFYTPRPVVSYIVRCVHELLQKEFGLEDGLADIATWGEVAERTGIAIPEGLETSDRFVTILDPATGTGTFLVEVIDVVHRTLVEKWTLEGRTPAEILNLWNHYVPVHLLPRLHGFELLMAPYAIAHMKIGLKLYETGYRFDSEERARVYLTNALEPPFDFSDRLEFAVPALAHEAAAVNRVKRERRFTAVIGNPPYSKSSQNQGAWIEELMETYKRTVRKTETQIQALSDDYSKFLRFGQYIVEQSGAGVLGYITNSGYLDGPLFRDMRQSMLGSFSGINILNLHGDSRKRFAPPGGADDQNVFDIQQGVAISLLWTEEITEEDAVVSYADLWGTRGERNQALMSESATSEDVELCPTSPLYLFIPLDIDLASEYDSYWHIYDVFGTGNREYDNHESYGAGFVTQQDRFAVAFTKDELARNVRDFLNPEADSNTLRERFSFCSTSQWNFERAKRELIGVDVQQLAEKCLYRPFDYRYTLFDRNVCTILRKRITLQFERPNLALLTTRRVTRLPFNNVFCSEYASEYKVASHDRNTIVFPLWVYDHTERGSHRLVDGARRMNFNPAFLAALEEAFEVAPDETVGSPKGLRAEDVFFYAYAIFHSGSYRDRFGSFLTLDFPRLPLVKDVDLFRRLAEYGAELVELHLMRSGRLANGAPMYEGPPSPKVETVSYADDVVWLGRSRAAGFSGVRAAVWSFEIGGYQVCHKWLKDRKGRTLSNDDIEHYQKIVVAIAETMRQIGEIDEVIQAHGGWPDAFVTSRSEAAV